MPQRYEREIEEILRSLDKPDDLTRRVHTSPMRFPRFRFSRMRKIRIHFPRLSMLEWLLLLCIVLTLLVAEAAYLNLNAIHPSALVNVYTTTGALLVIVLFCLAPIVHYYSSDRNRRVPSWMRSGWFTGLKKASRRISAPIKLWWLKWKYRSKK